MRAVHSARSPGGVPVILVLLAVLVLPPVWDLAAEAAGARDPRVQGAVHRSVDGRGPARGATRWGRNGSRSPCKPRLKAVIVTDEPALLDRPWRSSSPRSTCRRGRCTWRAASHGRAREDA